MCAPRKWCGSTTPAGSMSCPSHAFATSPRRPRPARCRPKASTTACWRPGNLRQERPLRRGNNEPRTQDIPPDVYAARCRSRPTTISPSARPFEHRPGRTISEADNTWFTLLTMNTHPLHFDADYAARSEFGKPLVNSCLTLAIVTGMSVSDVSQKRDRKPGLERRQADGAGVRGRHDLRRVGGAGEAPVAEPEGAGHRHRPHAAASRLTGRYSWSSSAACCCRSWTQRRESETELCGSSATRAVASGGRPPCPEGRGRERAETVRDP